MTAQLPTERLEAEPLQSRAFKQTTSDRRRPGSIAIHEAGNFEDDVHEEGGIALRPVGQVGGVGV